MILAIAEGSGVCSGSYHYALCWYFHGPNPIPVPASALYMQRANTKWASSAARHNPHILSSITLGESRFRRSKVDYLHVNGLLSPQIPQFPSMDSADSWDSPHRQSKSSRSVPWPESERRLGKDSSPGEGFIGAKSAVTAGSPENVGKSRNGGSSDDDWTKSLYRILRRGSCIPSVVSGAEVSVFCAVAASVDNLMRP